MSKVFATYGAILLVLFAGAAHQGYAVSSLFSRPHHAGANANHYHK